MTWPCATRSRGYLRRRGTPQAPAELAQHDCLPYLRAGQAPAWQLLPLGAEAPGAGAGQKITVPVSGCFVANNSIALLPDFSARDALRAGKLVIVLPAWQPVGSFGEHLYAIRPFSPQVPRAVQALVQHLREALQAGFAA